VVVFIFPLICLTRGLSSLFISKNQLLGDSGGKWTATSTGFSCHRDSCFTEEMKCGLKDDMILKDFQQNEYILGITPAMAPIEWSALYRHHPARTDTTATHVW
jgi:hypothetical protein